MIRRYFSHKNGFLFARLEALNFLFAVTSPLLASVSMAAFLFWLFYPAPERNFLKENSGNTVSSAIFVGMGAWLILFRMKMKREQAQRQQVHAHLSRQEAQLNEAQRIGKFGCWTLTLENKQMQWSAGFCNLLGISADTGSHSLEDFISFIHTQDRAVVQAGFEEALKSRIAFTLDYRVRRKDGSERVFRQSGDFHENAENGTLEMMGTVYDISEDKILEEKLRESEQKFRGLLDTAYDAIVTVDPRGYIDFANCSSKKWLGYEPEELIGQSIEVLVPNRFRSPHIQQRGHYAHHPVSRPMGQNLQLWAKRKDGSEFPVEIALSPFSTANGVNTAAFIRDMTDQKRAEEQQRFLLEMSRLLTETVQYQERLQRLADLVVPQLADLCTVHVIEDEKLILKAASQRKSMNAELIWQLAGNEGILRHGQNFCFDQVVKSGGSKLFGSISEEMLRSFVHHEPALMSSLQELQPKSMMLAPMIVRGRNLGLISFIRCEENLYSEKDLSLANLIAERAAFAIDNARLYEEAQKSIHIRDDVLAIVSHDLKNPLGAIRGFNELLTDSFREKNENSEELEFTDAISRSVHQMERLIRDLLDCAKIQARTFTVECKEMFIEQLVYDAIEMVKHHAKLKSIRFHVDIEPHLPEVHCDPDRIKQVLGNLLGNAVKFSFPESVIDIAVLLKGKEIEVSVKDRGPGISAKNIPYLFDRYWQAKETAKLGTGLGLSIAKGIVNSHCGRIWAESEEGKGATFRFTLPVEIVGNTVTGADLQKDI